MKLNEKESYKNIELPYEKCIRNGASSLTDTELMAVLLRCGTNKKNVLSLSDELLNHFNGDGKLASLANASYEELTSISGIGAVKATQILCIFELAKRIAKEPFAKKVVFNSAQKVANYYMPEMKFLETEHVYLLLLDTQNCLIKKIVISTGSVNSSILEPREIFIHALRHNSVGIIVLHNHPSGNPAPSKADILVTNKIQEAGLMIGINLIDHIIIANNNYVSLKQEGYI